MRNKWLFAATGGMTLVTASLIILSGCAGGGGPIIPPETGPAPSPSARFVELLPAAQKDANLVGPARCADCHQDPFHSRWTQTTHAQRNVTCESCHGPGSVHAAAPSEDNILTYPNITEAIVCGQCHGPTHEQWEQSRHSDPVGQVVEEAITVPNTYGKTCFRCHSAVFRAKFVDAPLERAQQGTEFPQSARDEIHNTIQSLEAEPIVELAHATHASAACVNCHDPHGRTPFIVNSTNNQAHLRRKTFNLDTTDIGPGAAVKQYSTHNHICGSCHNARGANPSDGALANQSRPVHHSNQLNMLLGISGVEGTGPIVRHGSHTETPDQCVHCHMPNRRHTFTVSLDQSCLPCHTAADAAARHATVRSETLNNLFALRTRLERWAQTALGNRELWNFPSILSEEGLSAPPSNQVPIEIKRARWNYHFVLNDGSFGIHNTPYVRHLLTVAHAQLDALGVSRAARSAPPAEVQSILQRDRALSKKVDLKDHASID